MADESGPVGQNEIDELLKQAAGAPAGAKQPPEAVPAEPADQAAASTPAAARTAQTGNDKTLAQSDIEFLLNQAQEAIASVNAPAGQMPPNVKPFKLPDFASASATAE